MKILLLTAVYPRLDAPKNTTATRVIHYFATAWQRMGHDVVVIHTVNRLPRPVYYLPGALKRLVKKKTGFEVPNAAILQEISYSYEGIPVYRKCLYKAIPQHLSTTRAVRKCVDSICQTVRKIDFTPDLIVGHWAGPNAQLVSALKSRFSCPNALVLHGLSYVQKYPQKMAELLRNIDRIGCRSSAMASEVRQALSLPQTPFVCYSGIPDDYVESMQAQPLPTLEHVSRFLFVGELIARKHVDTVIRALADHVVHPWTLDVVGEGSCRAELQSLATSLGVTDRVTFHGRISREQVLDKMQHADVFTMVSENEAFGLVYLEAMAAGCLTVGSRKEGIDGVIADGKNGFLVKAGDPEELSALYGRIFDLSPEERRAVARSAKATATQMTDSAVAARYLSDLLSKD